MEMVGGSGDIKLSDQKIYSAIHKPNDKYASGIESITGMFENKSAMSDDFHVFSMKWDEKSIVFGIDGYDYYYVDISGEGNKVFKKEYFIILNLAIGGVWPGAPTENTQWPQKMIVDWIRVYVKSF